MGPESGPSCLGSDLFTRAPPSSAERSDARVGAGGFFARDGARYQPSWIYRCFAVLACFGVAGIWLNYIWGDI
ncbi:MAG: hypothetical protein RBS39_04440 [Phycisphaerales bacterium]|nr:hypothetical protein [Phycisphaerales bacterium]